MFRAGSEERRTSFAISVARSADEVEAIRDDWLSFQGDALTSDPDYFLELAAVQPGVLRPHVVLLSREGAPQAMLVARVQESHLRCRLGYLTFWAPRIRSLTVVSGGALGRIDFETGPVLMQELRRALADREADVCILQHVPHEKPLYAISTSAVPAFVRGRGSRPDVQWSRAIPNTYGEFELSLSHSFRRSERKSARRLERDLGDRLSLRSFQQGDDLETIVHDLESVAARSYQRKLEVGFRDDPWTRRRIEMGLERDWFRAWTVYVDGEPVAFEEGEAYRGSFHSRSGAYDPAYANHRVGMYALLQMVAAVCLDPGIAMLDFGVGDAEYKRELCDVPMVVQNVLLFATRPRPIALNLVHGSFARLSDLVSWSGEWLGLAGRVRRAWRHVLLRRP